MKLMLPNSVLDSLFADWPAVGDVDEIGWPIEAGWLLLGIRQECLQATAALRGEGQGRSVTFGALWDSVMEMRAEDKRIEVLGLVHTHPGSNHFPSDADFDADRQWLKRLRGRAGVFGIGTSLADAGSIKEAVSVRGEQAITWWSLSDISEWYEPLTVQTVQL